MNEIRELRLSYSVEGMTELLVLLDHMKLGQLPSPIAMFLVHASNAANWHPVDSERAT